VEERRSGMPEGAEEGKRKTERERGGRGRGTGSRGPVSLTEEGRVERRGPGGLGGPMRIAGGRGRREKRVPFPSALRPPRLVSAREERRRTRGRKRERVRRGNRWMGFSGLSG